MPPSLSFSSHFGDIVLAATALGAIAGLYFFFHGFSLLQQRWPASLHRPVKASAPVATAATRITAIVDLPKRESRAEIIQLTPQDSAEASSVSMTQQGRIAAALLKAGIPTAVNWPSEPNQPSTLVKDQSGNEKPSASAADVSRVLQQGATASAFKIPALNETAHRHSSNRKATIMIWGGPALTLFCIYLLAARLGWL